MKGGKQRAELQAYKQHNRIVAQLNALYGAGNTVEQVRAAGNDAWKELGGSDIVHNSLTGEYSYANGAPAPQPVAPQPTKTTVRDGDTLENMAQKYGTTVPNLLAANPELKSVQTGMVLNLPPVKSGTGLPSNAAFGKTAVNQGANYQAWQGGGTTPINQGNNIKAWQEQNSTPSPSMGYNPAQRGRGYNSNYATNPYSANPFYKPELANAYMNKPGYQMLGQQNVSNYQGYNMTAPKPVANSTYPGKPYQYDTTAYMRPLANTQNFLSDLAQKVDMGYQPTDDEKRWLMSAGLAEDVPGGGGGGKGYKGYKGYRGRKFKMGARGGGGGGRSWGSGADVPSYAQTSRMPAFASSSGFQGLVNWRI